MTESRDKSIVEAGPALPLGRGSKVPKREEKRLITRNKKIGLILICLLTVGIASVYAQEGKPLGGLNELWDAIFGIQDELNIYAHIATLEVAVDELTTKVLLLEATPLYGPAGAPGLPGPQGATGISGQEGATGPVGPQGSTGPQGSPGPSMPGTQGETGEQGIPGIQGIQGIQGDEGIQGDDGNQGIQGVKGDKGDIGPIGPSGFGELILDSGWHYMTKNSYWEVGHVGHQEPVFVYMIGRETIGESHQTDYGGDLVFVYPAPAGYQWRHTGAEWYTDTFGKLWVHRHAEDDNWNMVRVLVWKLP